MENSFHTVDEIRTIICNCKTYAELDKFSSILDEYQEDYEAIDLRFINGLVLGRKVMIGWENRQKDTEE